MLIIGIDGATWKVLDSAINQGTMPYLKRLIRSGSKGILESTQPPLTPAAWSSFHMSKNPGHHGVVDFVSWNKDELIPELVDSDWVGETFWQRLEKKGFSASIINVPMTYPAKHMAKHVVTGILTPDKNSQWTYPGSLKQHILSDLPNYEPITLAHQSAAQIEQDRDGFIKHIQQAIQRRTDLGCWFMSNKHQDIVMVQYQVIDWIQHAFWYALDVSHPFYDRQFSKKVFKSIYGLLDQSIKRLCQTWQHTYKTAPQVLFISDHGFQAHTQRVLLGNYLYNKSYLDRRAGVKAKMSKLIDPLSGVLKNSSPLELLGRSQWGFAYIYPGFQLEAERDKLTKLVSTLREPVSKSRVLKKIWTKHELYSGPKLDILPDLLFEPVDGYSITAAIDKTKGYFEPVVIGQDFHIGIHHQDGIIATSFEVALPSKLEEVGDWLEEILQ